MSKELPIDYVLLLDIGRKAISIDTKSMKMCKLHTRFMSVLKEKILQEIHIIKDDGLLIEIQKLLYDIKDTRLALQLNEEQRINIQEAREDYIAGCHQPTEDLFNDLMDE
jgi:hypothetical protein